ncbi:S-adenosyl-L-methionine-dependent methyltransferase [Haematococcus lacustris]
MQYETSRILSSQRGALGRRRLSLTTARAALAHPEAPVRHAAKRLRLILEPRDINWVRWELLLLEKTERKEAEEAKLLAEGLPASDPASSEPSADEDEDDPDAPDPDALAAAATRALDRAYFQAYEDPAAHQAELQDAPLQDAWRQAIQLLGPSHIRGKVVLVLGCGPGHLAVLCAKAGAKQVIAVDGAPAMVQLCSQVAEAEGVGALVTAVDGPVESLLLSNKADVLIANWAGPGLLAGGMLRSLVNARIRLLKPGGLILPSRAEIFVGGIEDRDALAASKRQWERGFATRLDLSAAMAGIVGRPRCDILTRASQLCTDTPSILRFNPADVKMSQARGGWQNLPFQLRASREERLWGLVLFFDLGFGAAQVPTQLVAGDATTAEAASSMSSASTSTEAPPEVAVFTTHPGAADTHYNQLILNFPRAVKVRQGEVLQGTLTLTPAGDSGRDLEVMLQVCVGEATASAAYLWLHHAPRSSAAREST